MEFVVWTVGHNQAIFPIPILCSRSNLGPCTVVDLHDGDHMFPLTLGEFSIPLGEVSVCFPPCHTSISLHHTLNGSDGKGYLRHQYWC
jgi:hypothetical protein